MAKREREGSEAPPPPDERMRDAARRRLESVIPDLIKKAVIGGVDRTMEAQESIRTFIAESKLPKEVANAIFQQIDQTKDGLFRVVAKEIRSFLEAIDFQRELQKLLTTVSFEIKTEIRFIPNDAAPEKLGRPDVKAAMKVKRADREKDREREERKRKSRTSAPVEREPEPEPEETEPPPPVAASPSPSSPPEGEGEEPDGID